MVSAFQVIVCIKTNSKDVQINHLDWLGLMDLLSYKKFSLETRRACLSKDKRSKEREGIRITYLLYKVS